MSLDYNTWLNINLSKNLKRRTSNSCVGLEPYTTEYKNWDKLVGGSMHLAKLVSQGTVQHCGYIICLHTQATLFLLLFTLK
jgi:hypothetical protein